MSSAAVLHALAPVDEAAARHVKHQILMRAYQSRYIVLPTAGAGGSIIAELERRYDPAELAQLEGRRGGLERLLIAPAAEEAVIATRDADVFTYAEALIARVQAEPENPFVATLRTLPQPEPHYRDFLLQSSADLLAEASASAFGVIGAFGAPQSALFRILIDEFGYGAHDRKHSVLFQNIMRDFGLSDAYGAYAPLFDTVSLELHNTIHWLFQNPRNVFLQAGFLLYAETAYQRSTADHFRYLREFYPGADARYFSEHAHIDLHHTRTVIDDVVTAYVNSYGAGAGAEIVAGSELTRKTFARAGAHMLAVGLAFAAAVEAGQASYCAPDIPAPDAIGITPMGASHLADPQRRVQVGGLGKVTADAFGGFPEGGYGLLDDASDRL
jgi:hypothetical protein